MAQWEKYIKDNATILADLKAIDPFMTAVDSGSSLVFETSTDLNDSQIALILAYNVFSLRKNS